MILNLQQIDYVAKTIFPQFTTILLTFVCYSSRVWD